LTTADYQTGTTPTLLVVTVRPATAIPNSGSITITASQAIFGGTSGGALTVANPAQAGGVFAGITATATPTVITITLSGTDNLVNTAAFTIHLSANAATFAALGATGAVTFSVVTSTDATPLAGVTGFTIVAAGAVSDPIVFRGGSKVKFWLPQEDLSPMISTPDVKVLMRPLQGPSVDLQWFGTVMVMTDSGQPILTVSANKENITATDPKRFEQLDVTLAEESSPRSYFENEGYASRDGSVQFNVGKRAHMATTRTHGSTDLEYVHIQTKHLSFILTASHAGNEFPGDIPKQAEFTHIDLFLLDAQKTEECHGILPELWGWNGRNMSAEVEEMLVPPSTKQAMNCGTSCSALSM